MKKYKLYPVAARSGPTKPLPVGKDWREDCTEYAHDYWTAVYLIRCQAEYSLSEVPILRVIERNRWGREVARYEVDGETPEVWRRL
jgi:hypothetical protein